MVGTIARLFTVLLVVFVSSLISAGASSSMLSSSLPSKSSLLVLPSTTVPTLPQVTSQLAASLSTALPPAARGIPNLENAIVQAVITAYNQAAASFLKAINPEYFYSYGRSPPVYPTPQVSGAGPWAKSYSRAKGMVSKLTNVQKNSILYGASDSRNCSGFISAISSIGFPGLCFNDAESGVRGTIRANGYPAQLHIGASWNKSLAYQRGHHLGREFKAKGAQVLLGPVVGPIGRIAKGGRNWEGFSNDPYLAGSLVSPTISGMQENVIACVKHLIGNEQETNRNPFALGLLSSIINLNNSVSSNIDDRTMHELYLWPWYDAIKAGAGSVMCSYNRVNNSYACQNSKVMNGLLKTELGFQGFVVSDWFAQHTGVASANSGLDAVMPSSGYWDKNQIANAVSNSSVAASRLNDMVTRILATWSRFGNFASNGVNSVDARDPAAESTLFQGAVEGHVLVKNVNNALPLSKPQVLSLFGYDAPGGLNDSKSEPTLYVQGLANTQQHADGSAFTSLGFSGSLYALVPAGFSGPSVALNGTMFTGGGSGAVTPDNSISPYDGFMKQASVDNTTLYADFTSQNPIVKASDSPCLVFINAQSSESWDRSVLADTYSDTLVENVASKCKNTMVIIHNAGIRPVDSWVDHPNVTAIIYAHLPGQYSGNSLVEIMYGRQSPSGRLPYTAARSESDYGSLLDPMLPTTQDPQYSQSDFNEGLYIDYKSFIQRGITPRYAFGFGLTYSNFSYTSLVIRRTPDVCTLVVPPDALSPSTVAPEGGLSSLYDVIATVGVTVTNTGKVAAAEVAQLYVGIPNSGLPKALRGFDKQLIQPGKSVSFSFPLRRRDLSTWDTFSQQWVLRSGSYAIMVGKSVLDIQLQGTFSL